MFESGLINRQGHEAVDLAGALLPALAGGLRQFQQIARTGCAVGKRPAPRQGSKTDDNFANTFRAPFKLFLSPDGKK
jgi:hypothetical protein